mmetsp:Transcript_23977/g.94417  ORF Transcript_23977/g.94417 Transcript_23977/m.94417 type:complete len:232 (+) Transcript_23977:1159-1854(+)
MINVYEDLCVNQLAIPVVKGIKSPMERFAGAEETYTVEAMMQNGWALQSGTSHFLGQNFAKAFDVTFNTSVEGVTDHVWATSWGVSTRLMGALIMTHSDDSGLCCPPKVAAIQIAIVCIWKKADQKEMVLGAAKDVAARLRSRGFRVELDDRDGMRPGAKYYEWERKVSLPGYRRRATIHKQVMHIENKNICPTGCSLADGDGTTGCGKRLCVLRSENWGTQVWSSCGREF